jgi:hypothetical protein
LYSSTEREPASSADKKGREEEGQVMPDLLFKVKEVEDKLQNLKHKYARISGSKDFRRIAGLWKAILAAESEAAAIQAYVIELMEQQPPPPAPDLRKSYSYDRFEEKLIKRSNRNGSN